MIIYKVRSDGVYDGSEEFPTDRPEFVAVPRGYTRVAPPNIPPGYHAVLNGTWRLVEGPKPVDHNTLPPPQEYLDEEKINKVRNSRNLELAASDWTQLPDATISSDQKILWAAYRQSLRDIPQQNGFPWNVVWPTKP